ncbi:MAG: hypothetical protein JSU04_10215 [Bdellovibrionales bacterium]|nr:hypothetical protein [Bdellovibrionales bacterium]
MEIALVMGLFFLVCTMIFVFIAIFLPEWVGITGKKAHEVMREHVESPPQDSKASEEESSKEETPKN